MLVWLGVSIEYSLLDSSSYGPERSLRLANPLARLLKPPVAETALLPTVPERRLLHALLSIAAFLLFPMPTMIQLRWPQPLRLPSQGSGTRPACRSVPVSR